MFHGNGFHAVKKEIQLFGWRGAGYVLGAVVMLVQFTIPSIAHAQVNSTGACCSSDGQCQEMTEDECNGQSDEFQGDLTTCVTIICPAFGACCFTDGSCTVNTDFTCTNSGGTYTGDGTTCDPNLCPQPAGACCAADGSCTVVTEANCGASGGTYQGNDTTCDPNPCPQPTGSCCFSNGACLILTGSECTTSGGLYQGDNTACDPDPCPQPTGACCSSDGTCNVAVESDCDASGGTYQGDNTDCDPNPCSQPNGACCHADGSCTDGLSGECTAAGGTYQGNGSTCATASCPEPRIAPGVFDRVSGTEKGSLLIFSNVELRWSKNGEIVQDTFISLNNDFPQDVKVQLYFINGDQPLDADQQTGEPPHPGWNKLDNEFVLTKTQPTYWSVLTGRPQGVSPFTVLDQSKRPGRPDPDGSSDRVLRGYIVAFAIDNMGEEIRWNHLSGEATIVNYREGMAWEYNAWAFKAVIDVDNGMQTGSPGTLNLDGIEFSRAHDVLLMDFYGVGSAALSGPSTLGVAQTDLTLHPVTVDLQQETVGPATTKATFDIWNEDEVKFTGLDRCITCWDQTLLSNYDAPNHFLLQNLQTNKGKARINGKASQLCNVDIDPMDGACMNHSQDVCSINTPLLGVVSRTLSLNSGQQYVASGTNLHGMGTESASIDFDIHSPPEEANEAQGSGSPDSGGDWYKYIDSELKKRKQ